MAQGSITARVFTSNAEIPLFRAAVSITRRGPEGTRELLAFRLTNRDGLIEPFTIKTPTKAESQSSGSAGRPFAVVDMHAQQVGYDSILTENVQVFPDVETRQDFQLIPTAELPDAYDALSIFSVLAQDL